MQISTKKFEIIIYSLKYYSLIRILKMPCLHCGKKLGKNSLKCIECQDTVCSSCCKELYLRCT